MDLHTSKEPDWAGLDPGEMTNWQWMATRSNGWLTLPNAVSLTGAAMTAKGLQEVSRDNL